LHIGVHSFSFTRLLSFGPPRVSSFFLFEMVENAPPFLFSPFPFPSVFRDRTSGPRWSRLPFFSSYFLFLSSRRCFFLLVRRVTPFTPPPFPPPLPFKICAGALFLWFRGDFSGVCARRGLFLRAESAHLSSCREPRFFPVLVRSDMGTDLSEAAFLAPFCGSTLSLRTAFL